MSGNVYFEISKSFYTQCFGSKFEAVCPIMYLEFSKGFYMQYIGYKLHEVSPEMHSFCYVFGVFKGFIDAIHWI